METAFYDAGQFKNDSVRGTPSVYKTIIVNILSKFWCRRRAGKMCLLVLVKHIYICQLYIICIRSLNHRTAIVTIIRRVRTIGYIFKTTYIKPF